MDSCRFESCLRHHGESGVPVRTDPLNSDALHQSKGIDVEFSLVSGSFLRVTYSYC